MDSPPRPPEGASLRQMLLILRRRWRLMALTWVAVVAIAAVYTFSSTPIYRPQATLEIRPETPLVTGSSDQSDMAAMMTSRLLWENYYRTQETILTGPALAEATLAALPEALRREYQAMPDPVRALSKQLDIEKVRSSFILKIGCIDPDADQATQIVNTLVAVYLDDANKRLRDVKTGATEFLTRETLPTIRKRVDEADAALEKFKIDRGFIDFEEQYASLVESRRKIVGRLTDSRMRRAVLRSQVDALAGYGSDGVSGLYHPVFHVMNLLETLAAQRARIVEALAKETKAAKEKHPRLIELQVQLNAVEEKIREAIRGRLQALQTDLDAVEREEAALGKEQERTEKEMSLAGQRLSEFRRLEGDRLAARDVYNSYLKRHGETAATRGSALGSVRVVDHAKVPARPWKPNPVTNLALASVLGLALGVGAMMVGEQLDDRIASPNEVEAFVGLEVIGMIPKLAGAGDGPALVTADSPAREFEPFRGLRAEVLTRLEKLGAGNPSTSLRAGKVLAVLSPMNSEGKSTVAANLARVLAMEGRRVLLFDADMRRPAVVPALGTREGPGFEKLLSGDATFEQAVQRSKLPGVDVLGAKEGTSGAAEIAGTPRYEAALREAREKYDLVIIDSAPVNQVSESAMVARRADAALMVLREGQSSRGAAGSAKRRLETMDVKVLGAVLNCAVPHGSGYGYGYYYYYHDYGKSKA